MNGDGPDGMQPWDDLDGVDDLHDDAVDGVDDVLDIDDVEPAPATDDALLGEDPAGDPLAGDTPDTDAAPGGDLDGLDSLDGDVDDALGGMLDGTVSTALVAAAAEVLTHDGASILDALSAVTDRVQDVVGGLAPRQVAATLDRIGIDAVVSHGDIDSLVAHHDAGGEVLIDGHDGSWRLLSIDGHTAVFEDDGAGVVDVPLEQLEARWSSVAHEQLTLRATSAGTPDVTVLPITLRSLPWTP